MKTISFDFDNTLFDEDHECFITETLDLLMFHASVGNRIIITTSRVEKWAQEAREFMANIGFNNIPVFSAPDKIGDGGTTKSDVLVREGAVMHFDDIPDADELIWAKESGIQILLPPHLRDK